MPAKCQETTNENVSNNKRNRKRNVIWFNPPFSVKVKTKVGKYFLNLIRKHFPPRHKFSKLFSGSTIKVRYSCIPNIKAEIHKRNKNTIEKAQQKRPDTELCNCANKELFPLKGQCITKSIVYQANITANIPGYKKKDYLVVSETTFKDRYGNHKKSLTKQRHKDDRELSRDYWKVKMFFCDKGLIELVDDSYKIKQTKEREFVEETLAELTNQCPPFSESETLVFPGTPKSPDSLFLRKTLSTPEIPSAQPPTPKRPVKHPGDECTHNLVLF